MASIRGIKELGAEVKIYPKGYCLDIWVEKNLDGTYIVWTNGYLSPNQWRLHSYRWESERCVGFLDSAEATPCKAIRTMVEKAISNGVFE